MKSCSVSKETFDLTVTRGSTKYNIAIFEPKRPSGNCKVKFFLTDRTALPPCPLSRLVGLRRSSRTPVLVHVSKAGPLGAALEPAIFPLVFEKCKVQFLGARLLG